MNSQAHQRKHRGGKLSALLVFWAALAGLLVFAAQGRIVSAQNSGDSGSAALPPPTVAAPTDADSAASMVDPATPEEANDASTEAVAPDANSASAPSDLNSSSAPNKPSDISEVDNGQTLEVPQVVDPAPAIQSASSDETSDQADNIANNQADQSDGDNPQALVDDEGPPVGTAEDYENQTSDPFVSAATMGVVGPNFRVFRPPMVVVPMAAPPFAGMVATAPIILQPNSAGPLPSTSPLLMPSRTTFARPGGISGWWTRARR